MKTIKISEFVNGFQIKPKKSVSFLLGAGASISSGILSGGQMVWDFKRRIFCAEKNLKPQLYSDLSKEQLQEEIQAYFDSKGGYPELWDPAEYSVYFEKCYPMRQNRENYIQNQVRDARPSLGYRCLGELIIQDKINLVATTNFDDLILAGIHSIDAGRSVKTLSSALEGSVGFSVDDNFPTIVKLHGDYLYDKLKNTTAELQKLENQIGEIWKLNIVNRCLVIVGYAGNDNSVMSALEGLLDEDRTLKAIYWCQLQGMKLSKRAEYFMRKACEKIEESAIVEISDFDDLMYKLFTVMGLENSEIDQLWKEKDKKQDFCYENIGKHTTTAKTNALVAFQYPKKCYVFESEIYSWKELRQLEDETFAAILQGKKIWALGEKAGILNAFSGKIQGQVEELDIPQYMMKLDKSDVLGMFYKIIKKQLTQYGIVPYGKEKFYDPKPKKRAGKYFIYNAVKIALSFTGGRLILNLLPTVHALNSDGTKLDAGEYKNIINKELSSMYNRIVNASINEWIQRISCNGKLAFKLGNAVLEFSSERLTYAGDGSINKCFHAEETKMLFDYDGKNEAVNQLKGLIHYGPLEIYPGKNIRLAILTPKEVKQDIWRHLLSLNGYLMPQTDKGYLQEYTGFHNIFRCDILMPNKPEVFKTYSIEPAKAVRPKDFFDTICTFVDRFELSRSEFDILIIYIPEQLSCMREIKSDVEYFDLHDSLKIYCAGRGIITQIIEERSVHTMNDKAKIVWGLSTAIYTKAIGRLWKPKKTRLDTAYIGLSYVQSIKNNEKISIGCSQLFDSEGNGMKLYLRPLKNPEIKQNNPFMRCEDACRLMSNLKKLYDDSVPIHKLSRIVIHKTTPFTAGEMDGITKGLAGIDNIELLQIQEFTAWRAICFQNNMPTPFPIDRGTVIPLDKDMFLLWTHGNVKHEELMGNGSNYYKNSRGIPAPLLVKRFMGKSAVAELVDEILMLTRMNWNSGDGFYKVLPVTLDFAKILSRVAKQDLVVYDKPYDFRYFM